MGVLVKAEITPFRGFKGLTLMYRRNSNKPNQIPRETHEYYQVRNVSRGEYEYYQLHSQNPFNDSIGLIQEAEKLLNDMTCHIWSLDREIIDAIVVDRQGAENKKFVQFLQRQFVKVLVKKESVWERLG